MTTFDDPIFDPWGVAEAERPTRWRAVATAPRLPGLRPMPVAVRASQVEERAHASAASETQSGSYEPAVQPVPGATAPPPAALDSSTAARPPVAPRPGSATALTELVVPQLQALATKLELARHETALDERLDQDVPSVRFRVCPLRGPFDIPDDSGSVIEFIDSGGADGELIARLWLDPLDPEPSHHLALPRSGLNSAGIDRVLLDFVGKALRRA